MEQEKQKEEEKIDVRRHIIDIYKEIATAQKEETTLDGKFQSQDLMSLNDTLPITIARNDDPLEIGHIDQETLDDYLEVDHQLLNELYGPRYMEILQSQELSIAHNQSIFDGNDVSSDYDLMGYIEPMFGGDEFLAPRIIYPELQQFADELLQELRRPKSKQG